MPLLLHDVAVQPSGKIVATGSLKGSGGPWQGIVLRVRSDASASSPLDGGSGGTGNYTIAVSNHDVTF